MDEAVQCGVVDATRDDLGELFETVSARVEAEVPVDRVQQIGGGARPPQRLRTTGGSISSVVSSWTTAFITPVPVCSASFHEIIITSRSVIGDNLRILERFVTRHSASEFHFGRARPR